MDDKRRVKSRKVGRRITDAQIIDGERHYDLQQIGNHHALQNNIGLAERSTTSHQLTASSFL